MHSPRHSARVTLSYQACQLVLWITRVATSQPVPMLRGIGEENWFSFVELATGQHSSQLRLGDSVKTSCNLVVVFAVMFHCLWHFSTFSVLQH
ncbi:hypothetical protein M8J76_010005 [Diaphorina citri]|nr:hypothetical protein M8J75_001290 [Diaphorina citri]KAI5737100.1 hypothetical protein M8J76_010005 [Diaphorina citri]KAI5742163.1 hypothetical protein M8J77_003923 [Diaphorina citri]